jgi:hypothetical protein
MNGEQSIVKDFKGIGLIPIKVLSLHLVGRTEKIHESSSQVMLVFLPELEPSTSNIQVEPPDHTLLLQVY